MTVRTRLEREGGEKTSSDVEHLEKEILGLWEQLSRIAENVVAKDQQIGKQDADNRPLAPNRTSRYAGTCPRTEGTRRDKRGGQWAQIDDATVRWSVVETWMLVAEGTPLEGKRS